MLRSKKRTQTLRLFICYCSVLFC